MTGKSIIAVSNVSKLFRIPHERRVTIKDNVVNLFRSVEYEEFRALEDVNLNIREGEFLGVVGPNGSGKSTLLKVMCGVYPPSSGSVDVRGTISPFLELGVGFNGELTARDNVFLYGAVLGIPRSRIQNRFGHIMEFAELEKFVDAKLKSFSSGMWMRLAFAVAIEVGADIFLFDEVLAVGDHHYRQKCLAVFEDFKLQGKTVVLVSHDLGTMRQFCTRCVYLSRGKIKAEGAPETVLSAYAADVA